jgi:hypothetical protein
MVAKKRLIWWESEPSVGGSDQSRVRGSHVEPAHRRESLAPYYGPVTIDGGTEVDDDPAGVANSVG